MSDSTKLMASPDEVEEAAAAPAADGDEAPRPRDEEPSATAATAAPAEETTADETSVEKARAEPADEQEPVVVGAGVEPAAEVRGAFGTQEHTSVGDDPERADAPVAPVEPVAAGERAGSSEPPAAVEPEAAAEPATAVETATATEAAEPADAAAEEVGATEADAPLPAAEQVAGAPTNDGPPPGDETAEAEPAASGLAALKQARDERRNVEGRVFGWNPGGFHVVIDGIAAFCPRSEMELEPIADPESYLDKTFAFRILKIQGKGRRIVLSRTPVLREEHDKTTATTLQRLRAGAVVTGKVASLTDFGAFVDVGGVEGLVHVSEISRRRVAKPSDALQVGQEVEVKVLKVERGGRRVSLSMKALEPDPWREVKEKYPEGAIVTGKVERTDRPGAFIELEPGLVGLLPTSEMGLPREAIPARAYPAGKQVRVQVVSVDPRRQRIGLAPEGSRVEGTRGDYTAYVKTQQREEEAGFKPFAAALQKLKRDE